MTVQDGRFVWEVEDDVGCVKAALQHHQMARAWGELGLVDVRQADGVDQQAQTETKHIVREQSDYFPTMARPCIHRWQLP